MSSFAVITGGLDAEKFLLAKMQPFVDKYPLPLDVIRKAIFIEYGLPADDFGYLRDYIVEKDLRVSELLVDLFLMDSLPQKRDRMNKACQLVLLGRRS